MGGSSRASLGRRYAPDCGTKDNKFLSRAAAVATRRYYRPGKTVDGERHPFSMCDDFGCHAIRGLERRPLIKYGVGADLYFKGLKALSCIFFLVSILSLPAILATYTASRDGNRDAVLQQQPPQFFYYASLGAWGAATTVPCGEVTEGSLELACPAGAVIKDIRAYYGTVTGSCTCPETHKPDLNGACPGAPSSKTRCGGKPCFSGTTQFGEACCASHAYEDGRPDFRDVEPASGECASSSIEQVAQNSCLGQRKCSLDAVPLNCSSTRLIAYATCVEPKLRILGAIRASRAATSQVLSWLDALGAAILLAGGLFLSTRERRAQLQYGRYVRCSSAYTVAITPSSLPKRPKSLDALDDGLRNHFSRVLEAKVVDVNFFCEYTRRTIKLWRQRGALALQVDAADARTKLQLETKQTGKRDRKARFKFDESQRLIEEDAQREKGRVVACYVTFDTEADRAKCLETYASRTLCQRRHLRFCGRALRCRKAAEPRDLRWEHLGQYNFIRRGLVLVAFCFLLLLSSAAIYRSRSWKVQRERRHPTPECYLFRGKDRIRYKGAEAHIISSGVGTLSMADVVADELGERRGYVECFCGRILSERGLKYTRNYEFETPQGPQRYCRRWITRKAKTYGVYGGAVAFVVLVELAMDYVAGFLTEYERYASRSQQSVAHAQKLAFLKVVNAAVLIVLIHGNLNAFPTLRRKAERKTSFFGFMRGSYADFDAGWYGTVGVAIMLTLVLSWLSELACYFAAFIAFHMSAWRDRSYTCDVTRTKQLTQEGLNRLVVGPPMTFEARYASLAKVIMCATLFSSGCPLLNVFGFLYYFTQYLVDKFLFTKFYAAPPTMTNALALLLSELIPIMIAGRSVVAAWMWTAPSLIGADADDDELLLSAWAVARKRIDHANALPHVVLVIVVLLMELRRLLKCRCSRTEDEDDNDTTYFRAIRTATLERRLAEKTLKPRILNEYRDELRRRKHQPVSEEPQFQTLESYDLRACPVYAGEFALDSRAVRRVDNRRSVGRESVTSFRTSFGRGRDSLESAFDDDEEACASSSDSEDEIYVEETEPDDDHRRSLAHRRSVGRRPRATLGPQNEIEWHERWARDDRRRSNGASERPAWDVGLPNLALRSPPRPPSPESVAAFSDEEQDFSPEVAVVVPRAVREARPPPDDLAVVEAGEQV
jgi:hypothetical protein